MDFRRIDRKGPAKKTAHDTSPGRPPPYENLRNAHSAANCVFRQAGLPGDGC